MNEILKQKLSKRNEIFKDLAPRVNIVVNVQMPEMKQIETKVAENQESRSESFKKAVMNNNRFVDTLVSKLREKPLYTRGTSEHIGGSV